MEKIIITIDGPAASGKGRIAKIQKNIMLHIDSGLYRKIAKLLIDRKIDLNTVIRLKKY